MGPATSREEADEEEEDNGLGLAAPEMVSKIVQMLSRCKCLSSVEYSVGAEWRNL